MPLSLYQSVIPAMAGMTVIFFFVRARIPEQQMQPFHYRISLPRFRLTIRQRQLQFCHVFAGNRLGMQAGTAGVQHGERLQPAGRRSPELGVHS